MTILAAAEVTRVADDTFSACLASFGFSQQKPRHWIRTSKAPLHELIELHVSRIGYQMEWGIGAVFVPALGDDSTTWEFKRKRTEKTSRIDVHLGPQFRDLPSKPDLEAHKFELAEPIVEYVLGIFKRHVPLPNRPNHVADEAGIRAIVERGCSAALSAFDAINTPCDILSATSADYERSLIFPPRMLPGYWFSLGFYEIACGNDQRGDDLLEQAARAFDLDLTNPIVQESIAMARSHFRETAA